LEFYKGNEIKMLELSTLKEIQTAAKRLKDIIIRTPLVPLHSYKTKGNILLKPETLQPVNSFKLRGVFNAVASLNQEQRQKGIRTESSGNTAQALGWTAQYFGVPASSVLPDSVPASKLEAIKSYGVEPILLPFEECISYLLEHCWEREPYAFIHPWHNQDLRAGNGTIGLEIITDLPDVDTVYVPVGGGGLICGVGSALKELNPSVKVIGVEPEACPKLYESFQAGKGVKINVEETICDGVATLLITDEMYPLLRRVVDDVVLVSEKAVKKAMKRLMLRNKLVVEGAGALSVAAAVQEHFDDRGKAVCLITGGSIDTDKLVAILADPSLN
jgi:threonine dehydratase